MEDIPIIKVHHGTCDQCNRRNVLVVQFNYHKKGFRLCNRCYKKGQMVGLVEDKLLKLNKAEVFE